MSVSKFPFEVAYDHFAHQIMAHGLPNIDTHGNLPAFVALVAIEDGKAIRVEPCPLPPHMLHAGNGAALHALIKETMTELASVGGDADRYCLVVGMEAYTVMQRRKPGDDKRPEPSIDALMAHPDKRAAVVLMVHRPEGVRMGMLPVDDERRVTYAPLLPDDGTFEPGATPDPLTNPNLH